MEGGSQGGHQEAKGPEGLRKKEEVVLVRLSCPLIEAKYT